MSTLPANMPLAPDKYDQRDQENLRRSLSNLSMSNLKDKMYGTLLDYGGAVINVKHPNWGAEDSTDGSVDATSEIQAAMDFWGASSSDLDRGVVLIPPHDDPDKYYKISSPLVIPSGLTLFMYGARIKNTGSGTDAMTLARGGRQIIRGGRLQGQAGTGNGIDITGIDDGQVSQAILEDIDIYDHAGAGIYLGGGFMNRFLCVRSYNNNYGILTPEWSDVQPGQPSGPGQYYFTHCFFHDNTNDGVWIRAGAQWYFFGCHAENNGHTTGRHGYHVSSQGTAINSIEVYGGNVEANGDKSTGTGFMADALTSAGALRNVLLSGVHFEASVWQRQAFKFPTEARAVTIIQPKLSGHAVASSVANWVGGTYIEGDYTGEPAVSIGNLMMSKQSVGLNEDRIRTTLGLPLSAGDFALSSGWGTTASVGTVSGSDQRTRFTVTSAGTGQAVDPTITLTFRIAWPTAPFAVVTRNGGAQVTIAQDWATTTTTLVITWRGTPVAAETYTFEILLLG